MADNGITDALDNQRLNDRAATEQKVSRKSRGFGLGNLNIGFRILLVLGLPVLSMLGLGVLTIIDARHEMVQGIRVGHLAGLGQEISNTVHELQKERGMSAAFISSKGQSFASELPGQRGTTDKAAKTMSATFGSVDRDEFGDELSGLISTASAALGNLQTMRGNVTGRRVNVPQMAKYYTGTIAKLLTVVEFMGGLAEHADIGNAIAAYTAFLQAKERAGIERAMGAGGFGAGKFAPQTYQNFVGLIAAQNSFFDVFKKHAEKDQIAFFKQTITGPIVQEVDRMRGVARASVFGGDTGGISGAQWFGAITKKIDLMKKVEDRIAGDLVIKAEAFHLNAGRNFWVATGAIAGLFVVTILFAFFVVRGITGPVARLTSATQRLADGDTTSEIDIRETRDEVGTLVGAIKIFRTNLIESERLKAEQQESETRAREEEERREQEKRDADAKADEEKRAAEEQAQAKRRQEMLELADSFEQSVGGVIQSVSAAADEMQSSAQAMSTTADQANQQSSAVAAASEEAAANVQTVASAAEELSASVQEISRQVAQSSTIANNAVEEAQRTNQRIQALAEASQKIGDVVNLINDIASQTNLLALNATIEAARAGEAGKGFAVVATEVKSLADQTAKATEEIATQISAIQGSTTDAVEAIQGIGNTIAEINDIASSIAAAVEEQGASTNEIAQNVAQAAAGTQEVSSNIAGVTQAASETGGAAGQVLSAAGELAQQANVLRQTVDEFVQKVRAA